METINEARESMTTLEAQKYLGELINKGGRPISRGTLDKWLALGLPSRQPSGYKGKRYFIVAEVDAWLANRCYRNSAASEVAA